MEECGIRKRDEKILRFGKYFFEKYPVLRPLLRKGKKLFIKPRFSGWGMTSEHALPWDDKYGIEFLKTSKDIKQFQLTKNVATDPEKIDELLWRHWNISYAVSYAIKFASTDEHIFAECGVGDGLSAFFALREISRKKIVTKFSMHLYDTWGSLKEEDVVKVETAHAYSKLDINRTKKNLSEFKDYLTYHQGYIPESFNNPPESPNSILYLHIDLTTARPILSTLEFFYPRLVSGGVIIFDDYGWNGYNDTKRIIDEFFHSKSGIVQKLPTGQAIYYHK